MFNFIAPDKTVSGSFRLTHEDVKDGIPDAVTLELSGDFAHRKTCTDTLKAILQSPDNGQISRNNGSFRARYKNSSSHYCETILGQFVGSLRKQGLNPQPADGMSMDIGTYVSREKLTDRYAKKLPGAHRQI